MTNLDQSLSVSVKNPDHQKSADEIDLEREKTQSYEYLCHLEEAKKWMEACLQEQLPPATELEENLRNGVYLAKLCHFVAPDILPLNKIYDIDQKRYNVAGLQFRHTDNINHFLTCLKKMDLPITFMPETTDIYDKKNMPRVIYCIHALSTHLFKNGKAPQIQDLYGRIDFTNEEIEAVTKDLKDRKIQLPSFQKIGGIMTKSMAGDTTALHDAIMAVNECLSKKAKDMLLPTLQSSVTQLKNVCPEHVSHYYKDLLSAKEAKVEGALNRSLNDSYVPDTYDDILSQAEIQGHINNVNARCALNKILKSMKFGGEMFINALKSSDLQLQNVVAENESLYIKGLAEVFGTNEWKDSLKEHYQFWQNIMQKAIDKANSATEGCHEKNEAVKKVNQALQNESRNEYYQALTNPKLGLQKVLDSYAMPLYYEEMKIDREDSMADMTCDDIQGSIRVLTAIAKVSKTLETNNIDMFYKALSSNTVPLSVIYEDLKEDYYKTMKEAYQKRKKFHPNRPMLSFLEIQDCVDQVNNQNTEDEAVVVLKEMHKAVVENNQKKLINCLKSPHLWKNYSHRLDTMKPIQIADAPLYIKLFEQIYETTNSDLIPIDELGYVLKIAHNEIEHAESMCSVLVNINSAIDRDDDNEIKPYLSCFNPNHLVTLNSHQESRCVKELKLLKKQREVNDCPYVKFCTPGNFDCYINIAEQTYTWEQPQQLGESCYIGFSDIQGLINRVIRGTRTQLRSLEETISRFQAHIRGYLFRKRINDRYEHFYNITNRIVTIQRWWRNVLHRRQMAAVAVNTLSREEERILHYKKNEHKIVKIQALWRGRKVRKDYFLLLHSSKPPFPVVRHFSSILNFNAEDYDKDLQLQQLKNEVVQAIKHNQNLSQQLNNMDIKIGLLIQNRITLHDVIAHGKNLESLAKDKHSHKTRKTITEAGQQKGLKSLTKEGRRRLEGYQHLFYALQTNPQYLSKLLFLLPQSKTNKFLQEAILTLFSFGTNSREEYLLLKLLGTALREEIRCKFQKPSEIVTGNPLVLKMALNYTKQLNGQRALRKILGPIIERLLSDKSINIETNPVDIYKCWRNQLEMETGEALDLPYSVTPQQALQYEEVQTRLNNGIRLLKTTVEELLNRITSCRDKIPYGMLYMAKVLNDTLKEKFPEAPEKDILKVVGNLIYYHFINAAIVAPDAFDIVTLPVDRPFLSNDQRRNLASVAKILQFASSKKGFGEESMHLMCLNPFIVECHEKFKVFFRKCCEIHELDKHFNIHEYTEATLIHKPEIYISLQDICNTHNLILEYQDQLAPEPMDPLHELLEDLGSPPTVAELLGITDNVPESNVTFYGKMEVCLVLTNKFEVPENDPSLNKLFIKTKELLVSVLQFLKGDNLVEALETTSPVEEKLYDSRCMNSRPVVHVVHKSSSLNDCKLQLRAYLNKLELGGWVSRSDGYQSIVTAVARDLCNKGKYRVLRNQELHTLKTTKAQLDEKTCYYREQVEYYNEYIQTCLENLQSGKGTRHATKKTNSYHGKLKNKMTLKYTAAKLQEKGILLEVDGLPQSQFKNVLFEITPTDHSGVFTVRGKFMGVEMEKVEIDIQKLLELQFEGAAIMDMFGKAKINVNLLLYLLNRKFYGKT